MTKNKDWKGNSKSTFVTLGASNHTEKEREEHDFYATDPIAGEKLMKIAPYLDNIYENAVGQGHLAKVFEKYNKLGCVSDLIDRGYRPKKAKYFYGEKANILNIDSNNHKWNGDIVTNPPYSCFSTDTECYSKRGWLKYDEIKSDDEVLSVNPNTLELEWSKINEIIVKDYNETMYHFKQNYMDILCTKDHRMFAYDNINNNLSLNKKTNDLILSQDIRSKHYIPRIGYKWNGNNQEYFVLPPVEKNDFCKNPSKEEIKIPIKSWLKFFGFWLADGYCRHTLNSLGNYRKTIGIKQKYNNIDYVRELFNNLPFKHVEYLDKTKKETTYNIEINNEQLWFYLKQFGKSKEKFIPDFIKNLNTDLLNIFLESYLKGDGSLRGEQKIFRTSSKKMSEDLQEIILKLGFLSRVKYCQYKTCIIYTLIVNKTSIYNKIFYPSNKNGKCKVDYNDKVWCLNLQKNGVFLLRRNNKPFFSGNCAREFCEKSLELINDGRYVCMFLKIQFLEGKARREFFKKYPPKYVCVSSSRIDCAMNGDFKNYKGGALCYCWFIWQKGFTGDTIIRWFN